MIQTTHLTFQYHKKESIFRFPDINLKEQENLLILGKSGIGKTTFLHLLAGLLQPTHGNIIIDNLDIHTLTKAKLDAFRGKHIGLVFQKKHAIASLNLLQNIQARLSFSKTEFNADEINTLLTQLGLSKLKKSKIHTLSEGQLQRLGIALAVVHKPTLILADEPTSSLDDENCKSVMNLLIEQAKQTRAHLIVITHDVRVKPYFSKILQL